MRAISREALHRRKRFAKHEDVDTGDNGYDKEQGVADDLRRCFA